MYPNAEVSEFINGHFIPVKIHVKEQPATFKRFGAQWTPTLVVLDPDGTERYRFEGYLPAPEFLAQLEFGLAKRAFAHEQWAEAERGFRMIVQRYPESDAAPESLYWAGVAKYKGGDHGALKETAALFKRQYPDSAWAKKASVWAG